MARKAREKSTTGKYVLMLRGTESDLFSEKETRDLFAETVSEYLKDDLYGIRFFDDKTVMLVNESQRGIGMDLKPVLIRFARTYNKVTGNNGRVFADRFKSIPVEDADFEKDCVDFLNGKNKKNPFESSLKKRTVPKKQEIKKAEKPTEKTEPKTEAKPTQKRRNDMPTWLL